jgi:hypothetical protein
MNTNQLSIKIPVVSTKSDPDSPYGWYYKIKAEEEESENVRKNQILSELKSMCNMSNMSPIPMHSPKELARMNLQYEILMRAQSQLYIQNHKPDEIKEEKIQRNKRKPGWMSDSEFEF